MRSLANPGDAAVFEFGLHISFGAHFHVATVDRRRRDGKHLVEFRIVVDI